MKKLWLLVVPVVALLAWAALRRSAPPEVAFTALTRETIVSTLTTNGRVEPLESSAIRAEGAGAVERILVERGQAVSKGQLLVQLDAGAAQAALAGAQARIAQSQAEVETLRGGGNAREIAQIESAVAAAKAQLATARRELEISQRLFDKKAGTRAELDAARQAVERQELELASLEQRRAALVTAPDRRAAEARLREAQSGAASARIGMGQLQIRAPISGVLYALDVRPGAYLNPGDQIGAVGRLDRLRVTVFVDEPDLGRVSKGLPVTITWDALPGRQWKGSVERTPTQIVTLGTRQVGEVTCLIENEDQTLIPGTNVNAEIRSAAVNGALTIPKEALRRQGTQNGVYKLAGDRVVWQPVRIGISSVTRVQVLEGLAESDKVALPTEVPLQDGSPVTPVVR